MRLPDVPICGAMKKHKTKIIMGRRVCIVCREKYLRALALHYELTMWKKELLQI
jgi:hypothetical protein